jgi:hypothetical protein
MSPAFRLLALTLVWLPVAAQAEHPQVREGFAISVGLGSGSAGASCDGCSSDREEALSGNLRLGGYLRPNLFLGGETHGWTNSENGLDEVIGFYTATVQWYPNETKGTYFKGGLGLAAYAATDGIDDLTGYGLGLALGVGHDFRVGRNFSLTPYANYLISTKEELELNGFSTGLDSSTNIFQIGLALSWH